jgi:serralysin
MPTDTEGSTTEIYTTPKGGLFGGQFDSTGLDPNVRAVMMDSRWTTSYGGSVAATEIPYAFPTKASDYTVVAGYPSAAEIASFRPVTIEQTDAARVAFDLVASYTNLTFVEASSGLAVDAAFRFARYGGDGSEARFPANDGPYQKSDSREAGDNFLGGNADAPTAFHGTDDFTTIMHEMGHSFGLKHGHDPDYNGKLAPQFNDNEFSLMTYASYLGADTSKATEARLGSSPQSYMMFDIAALQAYYGANFGKAGTTAVYTWDADTGQQYLNGIAAPSTGITATHKIFSTIWTQGATATYDLGNFAEDQVADLRPGHWLTFSRSQLADLNKDAAAGTPQFMAQGNVYNALQYHGDVRSLVSNLITGSGNDTLTGNDANNVLRANAGRDVIYGGPGDDTISGGADPDIIHPGPGLDTLRDRLADMNGDVIFDFGFATTIDIQGSLIGRGNLVVSHSAGLTTLGLGPTTLLPDGSHTAGDFMTVARVVDGQAHTRVTFDPFLPALSEGMRVDPAAINGIANQPSLTGDGSLGFTLARQGGISHFHSSLGTYTVAADGTIGGVKVVLANTSAASAGPTTIDLGAPANGTRIGFFLIQDGFDRYGVLPDDLSFRAPDTQAPATLDAGAPPTLFSETLGQLTAAAIFHSFQALNPGNAIQVLSGVAPGGRVLQIGFEDLPTATGDNDFQDVVISILGNHDDMFVLQAGRR